MRILKFYILNYIKDFKIYILINIKKTILEYNFKIYIFFRTW